MKLRNAIVMELKMIEKTIENENLSDSLSEWIKILFGCSAMLYTESVQHQKNLSDFVQTCTEKVSNYVWRFFSCFLKWKLEFFS